jgi:hypothetical protein
MTKARQTFIPTIILTTVMPTLSALLTSFATRLTELENYETTDGNYTIAEYGHVSDF